MTRRPKQPPSRNRRALSTVRSRGRVESGGEPAAAAELEAALRAPAEERELARSLTHGFHAYPARMDPAMARRLVALVSGRGDALLDPFCGAGTVLVEAQLAGARALGGDVNPLALAIARARTWVVPAGRRADLRFAARQIAEAAIAEGKAARRSGHRGAPLRGPKGAAGRERDQKIGPWFAPHVRRELEFLAGAIDEVRAQDQEIGEILRVALSSILYKASRRASDTDPRKVDKNVGRGQPARWLRARVDELLAGLEELAESGAEPAELREVDARELGKRWLGLGSVDAVVTSPPYAGTYDYADQHQLRLDFLGMDGGRFRRREIGTRRGFRSDPRAALRRWEKDLAAALGQIAEVLRPGGRACVVLGDSLAAGRAVVAGDAMATAVGDRLEVVAWASQTRPLLGGAEKRAFADSGKREHVFLLRR